MGGGKVVRVTRSKTSYDFDLMTDRQKIDFFFRNRMPRWFMTSLHDAMKREEHMLVGSLIMIGIDMLSGYFRGHPPDRGTFIRFLEEYFDYFKRHKGTKKKNPHYRKNLLRGTLNSQEYLTLPEIVYLIFRCGLGHSFMVYRGGSFSTSHRYYVRGCKHRGYQLDVDRLYGDFLKACRRFELDVRMRNTIRKNFLRRFDQLWKGG